MRKQSKNLGNEPNIRPRKTLGQNFLTGRSVLGVIVNTARLTRDDSFLEIGAGTGILTEALTSEAGRDITVEIDVRLVSLLRRKFSHIS